MPIVSFSVHSFLPAPDILIKGADLFSERPTSFPVEFLMSFDVAFIAFIFGSSLLLASCIYAWARRHRMSTLSLPPGPRGMLFLGNAFDMPTEKPWLTFKRWADTYGTHILYEASTVYVTQPAAMGRRHCTSATAFPADNRYWLYKSCS